MVKLIFLSGKDKSVEIYKAVCAFSKTEFRLEDFLKNYPKEEISIGRFVEKWKPKEIFILSKIKQVYNSWKDGEIIIGFFLKREIFWRFPKNFQRCFTFGLNEKVYILLFSIIEEKKFSFRVLIHELFHANDVLRKKFGKIESKKHKWFEEKAQEICKKSFKS